jgi:hypothetical protein
MLVVVPRPCHVLYHTTLYRRREIELRISPSMGMGSSSATSRARDCFALPSTTTGYRSNRHPVLTPFPNAPIVLWGRRYIMALHTPARRTLSPASAKMVLDAVAHALPGALKWTAIVLVLLNVRSFPFAWHCECLLRVCCVDIQY